MCGRFTLTASAKVLKDFLPLFDSVEVIPRFNIAPTQPVLVVRRQAPLDRPEFVSLRWGLVPHWADDAKIGYRLINARAETAAEKPAFRSAFRQRRCLILADGFFEWQKLPGRKQPYYIRRGDGKPFAFAGLWDRWEKGAGPLETCTILTTAANELMQPLHERMPVILDASDFERWLDPGRSRPEELPPLRPCRDDILAAIPVSSHVNNARNDNAACVTPLAS